MEMALNSWIRQYLRQMHAKEHPHCLKPNISIWAMHIYHSPVNYMRKQVRWRLEESIHLVRHSARKNPKREDI